MGDGTGTSGARPPLVFHFTGNDIPAWGLVTLKNSPQRWPGQVFLLHDRDQPPQIEGVSSVDVRDWYDPQPFQEFSARFERPSQFRNGFWFHAVERFFVLDQWSEEFETARFLHTELDVVLMWCDQLSTTLAKLPRGIFYPRASQMNAGANFLFVNGAQALRPLLDFFIQNSGEEYEMGLLARFLDERETNALALPSHFNFEDDFPVNPGGAGVTLQRMGGVIDVHPIGTWIFGQDPRNKPTGAIFNHYYYHNIGTSELSALTYRAARPSGELLVHREIGAEWPVFALHVHSKVMKRAHNPYALGLYAWLSNRNWKTMIVAQNLTQYPRAIARKGMNFIYRNLILRLLNR